MQQSLQKSLETTKQLITQLYSSSPSPPPPKTMLCTLCLIIGSPIVVFIGLAFFSRFVFPGFPAPRKQGALKAMYGNWALITGASAGIGTEFAHQAAKDGMNVVLVARRKDRLDAIAKELTTTYGVKAEVVTADLSTQQGPYELHKAVTALKLDDGGPGLVVNNAGFGWFGRFHEQEVKHIEEMIQLNVTSVAVVARLFLEDLNKRQKRGGLIITSSLGSYFPGVLAATYDATKVFDSFLAVGIHGEQKLTNNNKVDVLSLEPGGTSTEFGSVAGSKGTNSLGRSTPAVVVDAGLNALLAGHPSIIPVHTDYFSSYSSMMCRPLLVKMVYKTFSKLSGQNHLISKSSQFVFMSLVVSMLVGFLSLLKGVALSLIEFVQI